MTDFDQQQPILSHVEPVLSVSNVVDTIRYWQEVLAFPNKWFYGESARHGGVSWHGASLQFHQDPEHAKTAAGNVIWVRVKYIDELYRIHKDRNATFVDELSNRPWGMDEYWVKDINGYNVIFSGNSNERKKSGTLPENIKILHEKPTVEEYRELLVSVGWFNRVNEEFLSRRLDALLYSALAIDSKTNERIGCAFIIGDNASFYYIKDVVVKPEWQKKRVGTELMKAVARWLEANGVPGSMVGLYTGENLEPFYKQFGFGKGFGMIKNI
jgi:GNAT superfamily N-acetyltransferase